ncbi:S-adenosyl-L-methionine-dependent methyltransferase [Aspergillus crustosus]
MSDEKSDENAVHNTTFAAQYRCLAGITDLFAKSLIDLSGIASSSLEPLVVFDNACGTGSVSSILYQTLDRAQTRDWQLTCGDMAQAMLSYTEQRVKDEGWPNTTTKIVDAQNTGLASAHYTHVFTAFAFNLFPDPAAALRECFRVLQPQGTLGISVWTQNNWFDLVRSAIVRLPGNLPYPTQEEINAMYNRGWDLPDSVRAYLDKGGFHDVNVHTVKKRMSMSLDGVVEACLMPAPFILDRFWTQEQRDQYAGLVPGAIRSHVEEVFGKDGLGYLEADALIAVAKKG